MTRKAVLATGLALLLATLAACAPPPPAFDLKTPEGRILPLRPDSRPAPGYEGVVGGGGKPSVRFSFESTVVVAKPGRALEIRYELSGSARLDVLGEGSRAPLLSVQLARGVGEVRWILPLPDGAVLSGFRFSVLPEEGGDGKGGAPRLRVLGLDLRDAEYGFEALPSGARFSRGTTLTRNPESRTEAVRVEHPFGPADDPVVRIRSRPGRLAVRCEGGRTAVLASEGGDAVYLPLSALGAYGPVSVEAAADALLSVSVVPSGKLPGPLALDPAVILALPPTADGSAPYALYRWSAFPLCLVFDFRDYGVQDAYLKRLAFFVEKEGYRGRLASDAEIANLHGWNAHDYRAEDLAAFFDRAERTSFRLSAPELELRGILEAAGILVRADGRIKPGAGAFISISRESSGYFRGLFLNHEASHALLFLDGDYRELARSVWKAQGPAERRFWNVFLTNRDYDATDFYLAYNELQAYLVQQAPSALESWLRDIAYARLAKSYPDRAADILADLEQAVPGFKAGAEALDAYLRRRYGLRAGAFGRVRFE